MKCRARPVSIWAGTGANTHLVCWIINYIPVYCVSGEAHIKRALQCFIICSFSLVSASEWDESQ